MTQIHFIALLISIQLTKCVGWLTPHQHSHLTHPTSILSLSLLRSTRDPTHASRHHDLTLPHLAARGLVYPHSFTSLNAVKSSETVGEVGKGGEVGKAVEVTEGGMGLGMKGIVATVVPGMGELLSKILFSDKLSHESIQKFFRTILKLIFFLFKHTFFTCYGQEILRKFQLKKHRTKHLTRLRTVITVTASVLCVALLYKLMSGMRAYVDNQSQKLREEEAVLLGKYENPHVSG
eukprot:GHVN01014615.1.p1 GENE.GHVN01014615.1~~GHVN01014615.1.p1  ORF type:complete len:235 (+),score=60.05 GHVN01014615.1:149-853(+)